MIPAGPYVPQAPWEAALAAPVQHIQPRRGPVHPASHTRGHQLGQTPWEASGRRGRDGGGGRERAKREGERESEKARAASREQGVFAISLVHCRVPAQARLLPLTEFANGCSKGFSSTDVPCVGPVDTQSRSQMFLRVDVVHSPEGRYPHKHDAYTNMMHQT